MPNIFLYKNPNQWLRASKKIKPFNPIVKLTVVFRLKIVDYKWKITIKFEKLENEGIERS